MQIVRRRLAAPTMISIAVLLATGVDARAFDQNHLRALTSRAPVRWTVTREADVPGNDAQPIEAQPRHATAGPNGSLYFHASDWRGLASMINVRVVDSSGRALPNIGRKGKGPGEFETVQALGFLGDSLWVYDWFLQRVTYFWNSGQSVDTEPLSPPNGMARTFGTIAILRDRSVIATLERPSRLSASVGPEAYTIVRLPQLQQGVAARTADSVGVLKVPRVYLLPLGFTEDNKRRVTMVHPWPMQDHFAASSDGSEFVTVRFLDRIGYEVIARNSKGVIFDTKIEAAAVPAPNERLSAWADAAASGPYKGAAQRSGITVAALAKAMREAAEQTKYLSPVSAVFVSPSHHIWVAREQRWPEGSSSAPADSLRLDVIDPNGKLIAYVQLPARARVLAVAVDRIWAVEEDADEGRRIVRYHINRGRK
jgi:hypothetical protein